MYRRYKLFILLMLVACLSCTTAWSQEAEIQNFLESSAQREPIMKSVFVNTAWGSGWGALIGVAYFRVSGADNLRESVSGGMTVGGLVGISVGIYMVINGISLNQRYLWEPPKLEFGPPTDTQTQVQNEQPTDPLAFWAAPSEDGQSWQAGLQLRF